MLECNTDCLVHQSREASATPFQAPVWVVDHLLRGRDIDMAKNIGTTLPLVIKLFTGDKE